MNYQCGNCKKEHEVLLHFPFRSNRFPNFCHLWTQSTIFFSNGSPALESFSFRSCETVRENLTWWGILNSRLELSYTTAQLLP